MTIRSHGRKRTPRHSLSRTTVPSGPSFVVVVVGCLLAAATTSSNPGRASHGPASNSRWLLCAVGAVCISVPPLALQTPSMARCTPSFPFFPRLRTSTSTPPSPPATLASYDPDGVSPPVVSPSAARRR